MYRQPLTTLALFAIFAAWVTILASTKTGQGEGDYRPTSGLTETSTITENVPRAHQAAPQAPNPSPKVSNDSLTLETALEAFLRTLEGKNRSEATRRAYNTDLSQFITWAKTNNIIIKSPGDVEKADCKISTIILNNFQEK